VGAPGARSPDAAARGPGVPDIDEEILVMWPSAAGQTPASTPAWGHAGDRPAAGSAATPGQADGVRVGGGHFRGNPPGRNWTRCLTNQGPSTTSSAAATGNRGRWNRGPHPGGFRWAADRRRSSRAVKARASPGLGARALVRLGESAPASRNPPAGLSGRPGRQVRTQGLGPSAGFGGRRGSARAGAGLAICHKPRRAQRGPSRRRNSLASARG